MMQQYALARPGVRLSYKVINSNRRDWLYSEGNGTVLDAARSLFGKDVTLECLLIFWVQSLGIVEKGVFLETCQSKYSIAAVLPRCDTSKLAFFLLLTNLTFSRSSESRRPRAALFSGWSATFWQERNIQENYKPF
jgi:hypothetical protein